MVHWREVGGWGVINKEKEQGGVLIGVIESTQSTADKKFVFPCPWKHKQHTYMHAVVPGDSPGHCITAKCLCTIHNVSA